MKRILSLLLALLLACTLPLFTACNNDNDTDDKGGESNLGYDPNLTVRVWTLSGTTGFGMAPLIQKQKDGTAALNYSFTIEETQPTNVRDALIQGSADIGAVPTNMASALYNATKGDVVLLALNTRGVLYLVVNTDKVTAPTSLSDLSGKTIYCPAQNPAFITKALLDKAGVSNVTIDTSVTEAKDLQAQVASGGIDYAILPEPMVTIAHNAAKAKNVTLTTALNITAEWDQHFTAGSLVQGCVVARKQFVEEHPNEVAKFLEEYRASLEYVIANPKEASAVIASVGIFGNATVAESAIPKCNLAFITGAQMKSAMAEFLACMPKASIGGALPSDDFYYGA